MQGRRASIKETGEEVSQADWERFDAGVAQGRAERADGKAMDPDADPDAPTRLPEVAEEARRD